MKKQKQITIEEEFGGIVLEVSGELSSIREMLEEATVRAIKVSNDEVCASMTFKIPAFIYDEDNFQKLKEQLERTKELLPKECEWEIEQCDNALKALTEFEDTYDKEFDKPEQIQDLGCFMELDIDQDLIIDRALEKKDKL